MGAESRWVIWQGEVTPPVPPVDLRKRDIYKDIQGYLKLSKVIQGYPRLSKVIQDYPRLSKVIQGYPRLSKVIQSITVALT